MARRDRTRLKIAILAGLLLVLTATAATSAASAGSAVFPQTHRDGSGAVNLGPGARHPLDWSLGGLTPGEAVRAREILRNDEGLAIRYALSSTSSDQDGKSVRDVLRIVIRTSDAGSSADGPCSAFDGGVLYDGPLGGDAAGFGDPRMGRQAGDRFLGPGEQETLCVEMRMPLSVDNDRQGARTSTTWTIASEQVAGNP